MIYTKRCYAIIGFDGSLLFRRSNVSFSRLFLENRRTDYEYIYAIQDEADAVLDLKVGESLAISFHRHDPEGSKGYIKRIQ